MDFGDILDNWEKKKKASDSPPEGFEDKDSMVEFKVPEKAVKIDAKIDLHGMTRAEAENELDRFFSSAGRSGFRKVLIIHGKGNHSAGGGVLFKWIKAYLEKCPQAGKSGYAKRENGGKGATWVMIKK